MGTNYYATKKPHLIDKLRGAEDEYLHIGKSSGGWCFSLRMHREHGLVNLASWYKYLSSGTVIITNEYDAVVSLDDLLVKITKRKWDRTGQNILDDGDTYHPDGCRRHAVESRVFHGAGTYDLLDVEFS
jgi:hypothetical protein